MKKSFLKSAFSVFMVTLMLAAIAPVSGLMASAEGYVKGDVIEFGSYPQSKVTDEEVIAALDLIESDWNTYGYYAGDGKGGMAADDYMCYKDVSYNGELYRAVSIENYRADKTNDSSSADTSLQDDNGYTSGNVYWFKYEPLEWRILNPDSGLVMCNSIIDSQTIENVFYSGEDALYGDSEHTYYAGNYEKSSIRSWLNNDFANTAFTSEEKSDILASPIENKSPDDELYDAPSTTDRIFLLSYYDVLNKDYGFESRSSVTDKNKVLCGTDYAAANGLKYSASASPWWVRGLKKPGQNYAVSTTGFITNISCNTTSVGVVPAMKIVLPEKLTPAEPSIPEYEITFDPDGGTCSETSRKVKFNCVIGDLPVPEKTGCTFNGWYYGTELVKDGSRYTRECDIILKAKWTDTQAHAHLYSDIVKTDATCTKDGVTAYTCSCGDSYTETIPATGHNDGNADGKCDACGYVISVIPVTPENPCRNAKINTASDSKVDYRTKVTIKVTAGGVTGNCHLVMTVNGTEITGSSTEVSYYAGEIKGDINYTVKVVDADGKVQKDGSGNVLSKEGTVSCNSGIFKMIIAFFKGLFGALPEKTIEP